MARAQPATEIRREQTKEAEQEFTCGRHCGRGVWGAAGRAGVQEGRRGFDFRTRGEHTQEAHAIGDPHERIAPDTVEQDQRWVCEASTHANKSLPGGSFD